MKLRLLNVPVLLGCLLAGAVLAKPAIVSIDELRASDQQRQTALIITQVMEKFHYRKPRLNDDLSAAVYERYLKALDANRSFFTAEDIARFERYRTQLDDSLRTGKLEPAFLIFRRFRALVEQRVAYAQELLQANTLERRTAVSGVTARASGFSCGASSGGFPEASRPAPGCRPSSRGSPR